MRSVMSLPILLATSANAAEENEIHLPVIPAEKSLEEAFAGKMDSAEIFEMLCQTDLGTQSLLKDYCDVSQQVNEQWEQARSECQSEWQTHYDEIQASWDAQRNEIQRRYNDDEITAKVKRSLDNDNYETKRSEESRGHTEHRVCQVGVSQERDDALLDARQKFFPQGMRLILSQ